jgi:hypothetical protein
VGSQDNINTATATKIYNNISGFQICKSSGISTTPREVKSYLRG